MEFMFLMLACLVIGLVHKTYFNLWLALGNVFTAINCFITGQFIAFGLVCVFIVWLIWWHFHKKTIDMSNS